MNRDEIQRAAATGHRLRPDWRADSLETFLGRHLADRPYRDVVIALAVIATDPDATTPDLLRRDGPWWTAAHVAQRRPEPDGVTGAQSCAYHHGQPAVCPECAADRRLVTNNPSMHAAVVRDAIRAARQPAGDDPTATLKGDLR